MEYKFLEIIKLSDKMAEIKSVKIKVVSKIEAQSKLISEEPKLEGIKYIARYHICRHGERGHNQSCEVEILKEVK